MADNNRIRRLTLTMGVLGVVALLAAGSQAIAGIADAFGDDGEFDLSLFLFALLPTIMGGLVIYCSKETWRLKSPASVKMLWGLCLFTYSVMFPLFFLDAIIPLLPHLNSTIGSFGSMSIFFAVPFALMGVAFNPGGQLIVRHYFPDRPELWSNLSIKRRLVRLLALLFFIIAGFALSVFFKRQLEAIHSNFPLVCEVVFTAIAFILYEIGIRSFNQASASDKSTTSPRA